MQSMERSYRVTWKHAEIGLLKNIATDMWRLDGDEYPCDGAADDFERLLSETDAL